MFVCFQVQVILVPRKHGDTDDPEQFPDGRGGVLLLSERCQSKHLLPGARQHDSETQ